MRKILTLFIVLCASTAMSAQNLNVNNLKVSSDDQTVTVSFMAQIDRKAAPSGTTVIYAPVITDGEYKVSLPPIIVQGKAAEIAWERHEWAASNRAVYENGIYTNNGEKINLEAQVAFQPWMQDSRIEMETVTVGCATSNTNLSIIAANILPAPAPSPVKQPEPEIVIVEREPTVVEFLQEAFTFVLPASDFDSNEPFKFYNDERDNSLTVYYKLNKYNIEKDYADNTQTLINLMAAIKLIRESGDAQVKQVVVAGFASPEGRLEVNDKLAWERAVSVKEYIIKNSDMPDENILLFNGSADWHGLRREIAANPSVPAQREALDIIDNNLIWDAKTQMARMQLLQNLNGGLTYKYLYEYIFPKLRNGAFIRVYFEIK